ncbi:hypothetical protein A5753_06715 [Mycobacterium sp. 852002-51971_SCH5477799-a]|uniref:3'-5' exonuclease n=1 Tax=Mycobacterium sp. 852002-51971_SCH5477799-a TaxID=1834106 RepID=UPI0007FD1E1D|nr:3'-5' exonuclease [Mycobacterium sp. 852002-51971_SCH5477799-a]OBF66398.1 hypothetical protein A5753_06715 [Mycobacterium sp. 852002-51971_SCH5477799-a]
MQDVTGATATSLEPTGRDDLVDQLNAAATRFVWWWPTAIALLLLGLLTMPFGLLVWVLGGVGCIWLYLNDQARRTVVLFYDVHDDAHSWFDSVTTQWRWLIESQQVRRIVQSGDVVGTSAFKVNSGASALVNTIAATASTSVKNKHLATNIAVPSITAGNSALYLLPDRLLIREGKRYSDIDYQALRTFQKKQRFIESSSPPRDALQVDRTWQIVNVKGGPDRRYKNNRMLPIMLYGRLLITSASGLFWMIQISRADAAEPLAQIISAAPAQLDGGTHRVVAPAQGQPPTQAAPGAEKPPAVASPVWPVTQHPAPERPAATPSFIQRSLLTRAISDHLAAGQVFTAVDLETTGLYPLADRIVEIGLVKFRGDGQILDEFATLVNNPGSSPDAMMLHQIDDTDLVGAPMIDHVLPEAFAFMTGTVVVAHNLDFEAGFLASSAQRNGLKLPRLTGVCMLQAARRQLDSRAYSLMSLYKSATGEWPEAKHAALGDARAVRKVLLWMLRTAPEPLHLTLGAIPAPTTLPAPQPCAISCRPLPLTRASVASLLDSFPQSSTPRGGEPAEIDRYRTLVDECIDDGRLLLEEDSALSSQARRTRLNGTQLRSLHYEAWQSRFGEDADRDWTTLTPGRRRQMWFLADELGLPDVASEIDAAINQCSELPLPPQARYLRGIRVGILGRGPELDDLRACAEDHGASIARNITKSVAWVATATPDANDAPHRAARTHQVPMLAPGLARQRLDEAIRDAEKKALERQHADDERAAQRMARDEYWRPTWRPTELDYDPPPLYNNY